MGWLQKAVKNTKENVSAFKKKGINSLTLSRVSGQDLTQELTGQVPFQGHVGTKEEVAAKKARGAAADTADATKSAADMQAIKDAAATQVDMPTIDSAAVEAARKKAAMLAAARGGRASTMLSDTGR